MCIHVVWQLRTKVSEVSANSVFK